MTLTKREENFDGRWYICTQCLLKKSLRFGSFTDEFNCTIMEIIRILSSKAQTIPSCRVFQPPQQRPFRYLPSSAGDIASDLYGPQFWDDNFQFSFSVVVSCKSNKQLGYFWWKNGTSSLKTLFTHFELTFVNLMSRHDTCDFSRFTW